MISVSHSLFNPDTVHCPPCEDMNGHIERLLLSDSHLEPETLDHFVTRALASFDLEDRIHSHAGDAIDAAKAYRDWQDNELRLGWGDR